ncbi:hypothetical protein YC2023_036629 [Brassica napus]|uniref:(rape) hypothetical protein n=1 Tax=Brassica napus TaxID=3708 RepID=A0A816IBN0_BRANA|nr:unnamed protein product [Brassica napus]
MHVKKCAKRVIPKYRFHATAVVSLICPDSSNQPISLSCLVCCFNHNCGISKSYDVVKNKSKLFAKYYNMFACMC